MKILVRVASIALAVVCATAAAEVAARLLDRRLTPATTIASAPGAKVHGDIARLPIAAGMRRDWFDHSPDPLPRPPLTPELAAVADQIKTSTVSSEMFKRWNARFIQERVCAGDPFFLKFPGFAFSFTPEEASAYPRYRYIPGIASPYGLVTNRFGFRGHEITADKPAGVIRIAAVGASTTVGPHGQAFSYPEFLERWLNDWAAAQAPGVRIEVINAGREGITSTDIAAIVKHEVMPLEPDIVLYHEGANQFSFRTLIAEDGEPIVVPAELTPRTALPGADRFALLRRLDIAVRRLGIGAGAEPRKPRYRLNWPASVDERHPDPDAPALPLDLPRVVHDLDDIRQTAAAGGAQLVVSSFIWMARPGLVVDPVNDAYFFRLLNLPHWPATYADIQRMADFQNRVFQAYAASRGAPFVDVSAPFPRDMAYFIDPVHMTLDGDRLRAWIVFQGLVPVLRAAIDAHRLPRPDQRPLHVAPAGPLPRDPLICTDFTAYSPIANAAPLSSLHASAADATVSGDHPKHVVTPAARYGYAAELPIAPEARVRGRGVAYMRFRVVSGSVSIGVLKTDRSGFLRYGTYTAAAAPVEMHVPLASMSDAGFLMITNAAARDGDRAVVDVDDTGVLLPNLERPVSP